MESSRFLLPLFGLIFPLYIITSSCKAGRPLRKTLPDQIAGNGITERPWDRADATINTGNYILPGLPFYATDTIIGGREFTVIYLRNPEFDSTAFSIIKSYEPFSGSLLKMIAEQGIKGVYIDLRERPDIESGQSNFEVSRSSSGNVESPESSIINVVFLWDQLSAVRAAGFMNELRNSVSVVVKEINNRNPFSSGYKRDCFNPVSHDFDEQ